MTTEEQKDINESLSDVAWDRIKFSSLWNHKEIKSNEELETLKNALAIRLESVMDEWIVEREIELGREAEVEASGDESNQEWRGASFNEEAWAAANHPGF